jgi:hypothetical protein
MTVSAPVFDSPIYDPDQRRGWVMLPRKAGQLTMSLNGCRGAVRKTFIDVREAAIKLFAPSFIILTWSVNLYLIWSPDWI